MFFAENSERYAFAKDQIIYGLAPGHPLQSREDAFLREDNQRDMLNSILAKGGIRAGDILTLCDADEVPHVHTVNLLKWCDGIPPITHLQLRNYLYSFEFPLDYGNWKSSAHIFHPEETKFVVGAPRDHRRSDMLLVDAGWHCSFCFRSLEEFLFKIKAYSHADRLKYHPQALDPVRLQTYICKGADIFDMLPQEYSFRDMIAKMGPIHPSYSAVNLPSAILKNAEKFKYLLPGHCVRQKHNM